MSRVQDSFAKLVVEVLEETNAIEDVVERAVDDFTGGEQFAQLLADAIGENLPDDLVTEDAMEELVAQCLRDSDELEELEAKVKAHGKCFDEANEAFKFAEALRTAGFTQRLRWLFTGRI